MLLGELFEMKKIFFHLCGSVWEPLTNVIAEQRNGGNEISIEVTILNFKVLI